MPIRKLILIFITLALTSAPLAEAKTRSGQPSSFKSSRHSKRFKQKGFKIRHGKIKH